MAKLAKICIFLGSGVRWTNGTERWGGGGGEDMNKDGLVDGEPNKWGRGGGGKKDKEKLTKLDKMLEN